MSAPAEEMSKSARKRANQKARAAEAEAPEPPAPEPAPKSKAAAKKAAAAPAPAAAEPKAKAKGKAKAAPAAPEPAPKAEAKAKAKGKAKAEPKPAAEPKQAAEPKAEPKKASKKAAAKSKAAPEPEPEKVKGGEPLFYAELDDGKGGEWEVSSGLSKQAEKRQRKEEEKKAMERDMAAAGVASARAGQHVPGLAPAAVQAAQGKKAVKKLDGKDLVSQAVGRVAVVTAAAAVAPVPEVNAAPSNEVSETVKVPEPKIGRVVGPKGANIIMIKEKTGVRTIDMSGDECTILGTADAVALAVHAVKQLVEKGYMSLAFEDFEEEGVSLHPSIFPDIIGKGGCIIIAIKKEAKCEIDIPAVPKNSFGGKKYKVTLAGSKQSVALGKEILNSIAQYGHHEITHPGQVHKEMEVEEWRYRFLIGSKGSEMRHIQNNYKVRVNIPREHSECQNVVIVGEPQDVDRACKYIEKIMYEADQPRGRGAQEKSADDGGGDDTVEDWMKPYMYQRK